LQTRLEEEFNGYLRALIAAIKQEWLLLKDE
jgi:hypothetical protein